MATTNTAVLRTAHIRSFFVFSIICFFFLCAQSAHAAPTSPQGGVLKLTDNAALFLIQFSLGSSNGDMLVPATTLRSIDDELDTNYLHYYIEDKTGDIIEGGTAAAILLSNDAPLDGAMYRVPKDSAATFTLLVLYVTDEKDPAFRARMRTLPFHVDGHLHNQQFNRHELSRHISGSAALDVLE